MRGKCVIVILLVVGFLCTGIQVFWFTVTKRVHAGGNSDSADVWWLRNGKARTASPELQHARQNGWSYQAHVMNGTFGSKPNVHDDVTASLNMTDTIPTKPADVSRSEPSSPCPHNPLIPATYVDFSRISDQMGGYWHWAWIKSRIHAMWPEWVNSTHRLLHNQSLFTNYTTKKILVYPSVLTNTNFARPASIQSGGPLGDLVQWADLIAALFVMGHNVTLVFDPGSYLRWLNRFPNTPVTDPSKCQNSPFDFIFTDIKGFKDMPPPLREPYKCKFRINDFYGTQAMFNDVTYLRTHLQYLSTWGGLGIHLKQFYTGFPLTPDNSFLGFAVPVSKIISAKKENYAVLYGKDPKYFQDKSTYLEAISKLVSLHATVPLPSTSQLPPFVHNHGILSQTEYLKLFSKAKIVIGVEKPPESSGALEALACGSALLTVQYKGKYLDLYRGKPTTRKTHSQNPYLEQFVGAPYYHVVDADNATQVITKLKEILSVELKPFIPYEFTTSGFIQRMAVYIQKQDLCAGHPTWPPLTALIPLMSNRGQSCSDHCFQKGLFCEPVYFEYLNNKESFQRQNITCDLVESQDNDVIYPAFQPTRGRCILQKRQSLFSCDMSNTDFTRLCPCRDYIKHQVALCKSCL